MSRKAVLVALLLAAALPREGLAQYPFGKNKVNYSHKDWKVLKTENVDIYYYPSQRNLVAFIAPVVEETFVEYSQLFNLEFRNRLPLVFYSSHYEFQQTNIIPSLISEYTGGFTDLIKGRIAIPFTGSLWELRHVIRHEMVHAFMLEKLAVVMADRHRFTYSQPPLWFIEGIAEYIASPDANTQSHMFVRDALLHGTLPDLMNLWRIEGSFLMYKTGEAVVRYLVANFGVEVIVRILENWWMGDDISIVLANTINMDLPRLNDRFMKSAKRRYYPAVMHGTFAPDAGKQLTKPKTFHSRPAAEVDGDGNTIIYTLCAQDGAINICRLRPNEYGELERDILIEGGRNSSFESIPAFRSKIEGVGDAVLFVAKRQERDAIYLLDMRKKRMLVRASFKELSLISSPTISPGLDKIVFSAIDTAGTMDLFLYHIDDKRLDRLTHDNYAEEDPDYHPTKDLVLFSSDRCENSSRESQGIYSLDINTGKISALTCGNHADTNPEWAPDGNSFLFTSDRDGIFNIYLYDYDRRLVTRQTSVLGGVTTPSFLPDQSGFIASGYYKGEFHLFEFPLKGGPAAHAVTVARLDSAATNWTKRERQEFTYTTQDYKQKLGLDFAGLGLAVDPNFGSLGNGGALALSDILGNHHYTFYFGNTSVREGNFLKRLNVGVNYINLSRRLNYMVGLFHLTSVQGSVFTVFREERRYGLATGLSFPFSKFTRLDGSLVFRFVERESDFVGLDTPKSFTWSTFLTYVTDNTLWTIGGPLKGSRYHVTVGHTYDLRGRGFDNTTLQVDVRKYHKVTRRVVVAHRFVTRQSYGGDFQLFYLGGPWDLRGYEFREFLGTQTYLLNNEIRFPLIDRFALALPVGALEFPLIRGALFLDAAQVDGFLFDTGIIGSFGAGVELNLGYAPVIRVNFTRTTDFVNISRNTGVELFIGYNY